MGLEDIRSKLEQMGVQVADDALEKIGFVGDGAGVTWAPLILMEGVEKEVGTEELVLIDNLNGNLILAVCRQGYGRSPGLRREVYSPGRAYARLGRAPSSARESFDFDLSVVGEVTGQGIRQNKLIIAPRSEVYRFVKLNPFVLTGIDMEYEVGYYKDHEDWKVPVLTKYIPYHIGVFCVTGWGKTSLVRCKIIPLLRKTGYNVLIFDWKGDDYVPYYGEDHVVKGISLLGGGAEEEALAEELLRHMDYCGYDKERKTVRGFRRALKKALKELRAQDISSGAELKEKLKEKACEYLGLFVRWRLEENEELFRSYLDEVSDEVFEDLLTRLKGPTARSMTPEELIELVREKGIVVVDLSGNESEDKLRIFLRVAKVLRRKMDVEKEKVGIALVIDEAPQYCPWKPEGVQKETTSIIVDLCALGRSYELPVVLLSQGMAGDIGINAAVRRNINTWFIGKVHPLDRTEAEKLLPGINLDFLQSLEVGHFYFFGNMNPSPVPLLIRFKIEREAEGGERGAPGSGGG